MASLLQARRVCGLTTGSRCTAQRQHRVKALMSQCREGQQPFQGNAGRRAVLSSFLGSSIASSHAGPALAAPASSDLQEGVRNWIDLGVRYYEASFQDLFAQLRRPESDEGQTAGGRRRLRNGTIAIPGLNSFSFVHGVVVGGAVFFLVAAPVLTRGWRQSTQPTQQGPGGSAVGDDAAASRAEVLAALQQLVLRPDVHDMFTDPAVHTALDDVRKDVTNIARYKNNPAVVQAFEKLLEIEGMLERL